MSNPKKFAKNYKKSKDSAKTLGCGSGLSGKICRRNNSKLNKSKKQFAKEFKKSYYYKDTNIVVDSKDHYTAEKTASKVLVKYLKASIDGDLDKIPFEKGMLTLYKKDKGVYSGFFQDTYGQVIENFDDQTVEMIAKNMELKDYYTAPEESSSSEDSTGAHIKIKYGDLELEIRKSVHEFVNDFKKNKDVSTSEIKKSIKAWRRNAKKRYKSNIDAARDLVANWEANKEEFGQILHATNQDDNE